MPLKRAARGQNDLLTTEPQPDGTVIGNAKMEVFALESAILEARKSNSPTSLAMSTVFAQDRWPASKTPPQHPRRRLPTRRPRQKLRHPPIDERLLSRETWTV
jgi:hypothetical protein